MRCKLYGLSCKTQPPNPRPHALPYPAPAPTLEGRHLRPQALHLFAEPGVGPLVGLGCREVAAQLLDLLLEFDKGSAVIPPRPACFVNCFVNFVKAHNPCEWQQLAARDERAALAHLEVVELGLHAPELIYKLGRHCRFHASMAVLHGGLDLNLKLLTPRPQPVACRPVPPPRCRAQSRWRMRV